MSTTDTKYIAPKEPHTLVVQVGKYFCKQCPFCGATNLSITDWCDDDGEYDAIECGECKGCAPAPAWNKRSSEAAA